MKKTLILTTLLLATSLFTAEKKIVRGVDRFKLVYELQLPKLEQKGTLWIPLAQTDAYQKLQSLTIESPVPWRKTRDAKHHNELLILNPGPDDSGKRITIRYQVERTEKKPHSEVGDPKQYLKADKLVPLSPRFIPFASKATKNLSDDFARGKALYQHVLGRMRYDKSGKGWGRGDALYACDARTGNCTDFHAYFIALCRAINIPARFAIGFTIPADRDTGVISGYHCWAEFHADAKWVPVDISEADKHPELTDYYFGHHPANRLEVSRGRDISPKPAPRSGPFNYFIGPHLEVAGKKMPLKATFEFKRLMPK